MNKTALEQYAAVSGHAPPLPAPNAQMDYESAAYGIPGPNLGVCQEE